MTSRELTVPGVLWLLLSLFLTVVLVAGSGGPSGTGTFMAAWTASVGMLIGSGLVVAGAVVKVLRLEPAPVATPRDGRHAPAAHRDHFQEQ